jgi:DnaD/phage-associated family protein
LDIKVHSREDIKVHQERKKENIKENIKESDSLKCFKFYNKNFSPITQFIAEDINSFLDDGVEDDLIVRSLEISLENNVNNWRYAKGVLNKCISKNIKTLSQYESQNKKKEEPKKKYPTYDEVDFGEEYWNSNNNMMILKQRPIPREPE